jgi:hypothetical protein
MTTTAESSSFRDPSGFVYFSDGVCYRQINSVYKKSYDYFIESGLYEKLINERLLIPHEPVDSCNLPFSDGYKTIRPKLIPFISYPYEWCFTQFKNAALTTLTILKYALSHNMTLKDANAYNIQFFQGKPILIDTLSFEKYQEGEPWAGYKQFCENFLGPLALMSYKDIRLGRMLREYIGGIPLDLVSSLLPRRTYLNFHLATHIHLHARFQTKHAEKASTTTNIPTMSRKSLLGLIDSLESAINNMSWRPGKSEWVNYYSECAHVPKLLEQKTAQVADYLDVLKPGTVWDLGANTGVFSRIASDRGINTISMDIDSGCVETNYLQMLKNGDNNLLPIWIDLNNPSPGIGWENKERMSLQERGPVETILALALIHHLAISNNVPLAKIAVFFNNTCRSLIIEFVPKSDSMVQKLLASREDIFPNYTQKTFENEFLQFFNIIKSEKVGDSERTLYLMKSKNHV